jgi:hypothetical protein
MKNCPHCGKENDPRAFYCEACGQIIEKSANNDLYTINQQEEMYGVTHRSTQDAVSTPPNYQETPVYATPSLYNPYGAGEIYTPSYAQQFAGIQTPYNATPMSPPPPIRQKRSIGGITLSIILYIFNLFWISFGLFGFLMAFTNDTNIPGIALIVSALLGIVVLVFIMIKHKKPRLKWWKRLIAFLSIIIIGFIALIIAAILSNMAPEASQSKFGDIYFGGTLVVFGILAMIASVL